ncbi:C-C motif chemokine 13-like [Mugil cephalus]|uniref:C-C motif chemokine 13-like n=1 Tax=Mugil cephalus TaxID=48193 RepID=UPI001FB6F68F|nr:C-C motif chemokine 13-like [Mugil cephalus]
MKTAHILLLCILGAALLSPVLCNNSLGPDDCCFTYYTRRIRKDLIKSYYMTDNRCPKTAAILVTARSRHICVDPSETWVAGIMKHLDEGSF